MNYAWTDGSNRPHTTGCGGAAVRLMNEQGLWDEEFHICNATSQQAELHAVINAVDMVSPGMEIHVVTDSQYVVKGFNREWKLKQNLEIWERLFDLAEVRTVTLEWQPRCSTVNLVDVDRRANMASGAACP